MRIVLATPNFPPEFLGGTERVVLALARSLRERGDDVSILTGSDRPLGDGDEVLREVADGFEVFRIRRLPEEVYGLDLSRSRVLAACERAVAAKPVDVLHVHHWALLSQGLLRRARALGVVGVATLHDVWTTCPRFFRRPPHGFTCPTGAGRDACVPCAMQGLPGTDARAVVAGLAARDADLRAELAAAARITVPSASCAARIAEHLPWDGPLDVVPHGLLEPPTGRVAREPGPAGVLRIGTFGNLVEEKGVMLLIWACRGIPGIELHLHGPFLAADFEAQCRAKAAEFGVSLVCHGPYDVADRHPAERLDLAVFPSLCEETYGLVVEEALVRGTPVVVSDRGALAERIGDGGVVVRVDELGPLADALRALATAPERLERLRAGLPREFATITDAAVRYRQIYAEAIARTAV